MTTWMCTRQGELYHHGIKGQKWGIRRFQNKDGSLTPEGEKRYADGAKEGRDYKIYGDGRIEIKSGTNLQRLIGSNSKQDLSGVTYASFTKHDNNSYLKVLAGKGFLGGGRDTKLTLKTTADLKSPSSKDAAKMFFKMLKDDPELADTYSKTLFGKKYTDKELDSLIKGVNEKKLLEDYQMANSAFMFNDSGSRKIKESFFDKVSKSGYNMLLDENDVGSGYAKAPVILINCEKTVKLEKTEGINDDMRKSAKEYMKTYKKNGEDWMRKHGLT